MNPRQRMAEFLQRSGGSARFDAFAREHLFGKTGFYTAYADMRVRPHEIATPSQNAEYVKAIAKFVFSTVKQVLEARSRNAPYKYTFVEYGGGAGQFKREFMRLYGEYKRGEGRGELNYISVDPNAAHRNAQETPGTLVVAGTAQKTGLPDASVDFVFAEEVVSSLPFRIFDFDSRQGKIGREAFVKPSGRSEVTQTTEVEYRPVERDEHVELVERHLSGSRDKPRFYRYSNEYHDFWREAQRILKPRGFQFTIDYHEHTAGMSHDLKGFRENALTHPYETDLTHGLDFGLQLELAKQHGFIADAAELLDLLPKLGIEPNVHLQMRKVLFAAKKA